MFSDKMQVYVITWDILDLTANNTTSHSARINVEPILFRSWL